MNLSTDSSDCSDSDGSVRGRGKEPLPGHVPFYFLKTGKSKGEGVLITHNGTFKFTKNNVNRKGTLLYYACSHKLSARPGPSSRRRWRWTRWKPCTSFFWKLLRRRFLEYSTLWGRTVSKFCADKRWNLFVTYNGTTDFRILRAWFYSSPSCF